MKKNQDIFVAVHMNGFPVVTQHGMVASTLKRICVEQAEAFWGLAYKHAKRAGVFKIVKYSEARAEQRKDA